MKLMLAIVVPSIIIIGIILLSWVFISSLLAATPGVAAAIISAIAGVIIMACTMITTNRREINSRHFNEKKNAYIPIINLIFDFHKATITGKEIPDKEVMDKILEFKKNLVIWGNAEAIKTWDEYEQLAGKPGSNREIILRVDKIIRCIRKELGHKDKNLKEGQLTAILLKSEEKHLLYSDVLQGEAA